MFSPQVSTLVLLTSLGAGALHAAELTATCPNGLRLAARVDDTVVDFRFWENLELRNSQPHFRGTLRINNPTPAALMFSTQHVLLLVDQLAAARAYHRAIYSSVIDFPTGVAIASAQQLEVAVYWPTTAPIGHPAQHLALQCVADPKAAADSQ